MNIYLLVEGKRTEKKVYPLWLSFLTPQLSKVHAFDAVMRNTYYLFSSNGYPSILEHIEHAIQDINNVGLYDCFIICVDADEVSIEERTQEIQQLIQNTPITAKPVVIVQNRCIETWFLGNRKLCAVAPNNHPFIEYKRFYDVSKDDPELMEKPATFIFSISQFHVEYLKQMLKEKRLNYSKNDVHVVCQEAYVNELQRRVQETPHLKTLREFFNFWKAIQAELEQQ